MKFFSETKVIINLFKTALFGGIVISLIIFADDMKVCITNSTKMWAFVLIPALFPYLALTKYIASSGALSVFSHTERLICRIFGVSRSSASVYICSLFSGYPTGALCASKLYYDKLIGIKEAEKLICFTNNPSPVFLITAVGTGMLGSLKDGIALYVIQTLSAFIWAVSKRTASKSSSHSNLVYHPLSNSPKPVSFRECVSDATETMVKIGGYVIISAATAKIISLWLETANIGNPLINNALINAVFEISNGAKAICIFGNNHITFTCLCILSAWGGISVIMQITAVAPKGISTKRIVCARIVQSVTSGVAGFLYKLAEKTQGYTSPASFVLKISVCLCIIVFLTAKLTAEKHI